MRLKSKGGLMGLAGLVLLVIIVSFILTRQPVEATDLVVIGSGASGMSAALEAEARGYRVILLEKMPYVGGNTLRATAGINALGTKEQEAITVEDSKAQFIEDVMASGHRENNPVMVELLVEKSTETIEWLQSKSIDLSDVGILAGHTYPRTHRPSGGKPVGNEIVQKLKAAVEASTIDLRLENTAFAIEVKDNTVRSVSVEDRYGKHYKINTPNVVIATGGFGGSPETFVYYNQKLKGYATTNSPSATGDFIQLVDSLDVKLVNLDYIQTHPTASSEYGVLITEALRGNGGILINQLGQRFADELKNRDMLSEDLVNQPDKEVYLVFNEAIRTSLEATDHYIDLKLLSKGETLEALANEMRIDQSAFMATINQYNQYVDEGLDPDFHRQDLKVKLDKGPYYAIKVMPAVHYCMGGILIDSQARVLTASDETPIIGLYASGEATGGIHGANRLGGNSLLDAVVFGRIAGQSLLPLASQ